MTETRLRLTLFLLILAALVCVLSIRLIREREITLPRQTFLDIYWDTGEYDPGKHGIVDEFQARYPQYTVRLTGALTAKPQKSGRKREEETPLPGDVFVLDRAGIARISEWSGEPWQNIFENLTDYPDDSSLGEEASFAKRERYFIPVVMFIHPLFYNTALFEKAGVDRPPKTRKEFLECALKLKASGVTPFALSLAPDNPLAAEEEFASWVLAAGFPQEGYGEEAVREAVDFLSVLHKNGCLTNDVISLTRAQKIDDFGSGRTGMIIGSISDIPRLNRPGLSFNLSAVPSDIDNRQALLRMRKDAIQASDASSEETDPVGKDDTGSGLIVGKPRFAADHWTAAVSRSCRHREAALAFIAFLTEKHTNETLATEVYGIPVNREALKPLRDENPLYDKALTLLEGGEWVDEPAPADILEKLSGLRQEIAD